MYKYFIKKLVPAFPYLAVLTTDVKTVTNTRITGVKGTGHLYATDSVYNASRRKTREVVTNASTTTIKQ